MALVQRMQQAEIGTSLDPQGRMKSKQSRVLHLQCSFCTGRPVGHCWIRFEDGAQYSGPFLDAAPPRSSSPVDLPGVRAMAKFHSASASEQARTVVAFNPYRSSLGEPVDPMQAFLAENAQSGTAGSSGDPLHWGIWTSPNGSTIQGPCVDNYFNPAEASGFVLETLPSGEMYQGYVWQGQPKRRAVRWHVGYGCSKRPGRRDIERRLAAACRVQSWLSLWLHSQPRGWCRRRVCGSHCRRPTRRLWCSALLSRSSSRRRAEDGLQTSSSTRARVYGALESWIKARSWHRASF